MIETELRTSSDTSDNYPSEIFYPQKQVYPDIKVWKTSDTRNDAESGRCYISQTFCAEDKKSFVLIIDSSLIIS